MNKESAEEIEKSLLQLPSRLAARRHAAARKLADLSLDTADYPDIPLERFEEFKRAVVEAVSKGRNDAAVKQAMTVSSLAIGYIPLVIYIIARFFGISLGAIFGMVAVLWLVFWYFRTLNHGLKAVAVPANRALEIGREVGLFQGPIEAQYLER